MKRASALKARFTSGLGIETRLQRFIPRIIGPPGAMPRALHEAAPLARSLITSHLIMGNQIRVSAPA